MRSLARRTMDKWVGKMWKDREARYLGEGKVFIVPSKSDLWSHNVVARVVRHTAKRTYVEWVCSCKGFHNSHEDECVHVRAFKEEWAKTEEVAG